LSEVQQVDKTMEHNEYADEYPDHGDSPLFL